mmetsp:Transcript_44224/g.144902  ORF Transcript_44224/g.144902 Transcript_44224/m.144902 type:complete len:217 (-) Transcript_44224:2594-3244(-)
MSVCLALPLTHTNNGGPTYSLCHGLLAGRCGNCATRGHPTPTSARDAEDADKVVQRVEARVAAIALAEVRHLRKSLEREPLPRRHPRHQRARRLRPAGGGDGGLQQPFARPSRPVAPPKHKAVEGEPQCQKQPASRPQQRGCVTEQSAWGIAPVEHIQKRDDVDAASFGEAEVGAEPNDSNRMQNKDSIHQNVMRITPDGTTRTPIQHLGWRLGSV